MNYIANNAFKLPPSLAEQFSDRIAAKMMMVPPATRPRPILSQRPKSHPEESASQKRYAILRRMPEHFVSINDLAQEMGVDRTVVKAALERLHDEGAVESISRGRFRFWKPASG